MMQNTEFENLLTQTENQALKFILSHLKDGIEGNISISQLTNESSISRPVFKNVIQKMKNNAIAEIENQGVKYIGSDTYIDPVYNYLLTRISSINEIVISLTNLETTVNGVYEPITTFVKWSMSNSPSLRKYAITRLRRIQ